MAKAAAHTSRLRIDAESAASNFGSWFSARAIQVGASAAKIRSNQVQDRVTAAGSFVAIALFAAISVDALLGGGLEFGANAVAAQPARRFVALAALPEITYQPPAAYIATPPDNARVVAVSYSPAAEQLLGGPIADEEEALADAEDALEVETAPTPDAPVKQEAPSIVEAVKTVPF
ncbi:MAG: hypothetical protein ABL883_01170 [Terricaulis sp.]